MISIGTAHSRITGPLPYAVAATIAARVTEIDSPGPAFAAPITQSPARPILGVSLLLSRVPSSLTDAVIEPLL